MRILLTNDDGIHAPGIRALWSALCAAGHEVLVVAPLSEQSGVSASLTVHRPLRAHAFAENGMSGFAVDGSPVDCVKVAVSNLCKEKPDLVVAGMNNGANVGVDIFYSGTVAAASEACMLGFPSLAVSRARPNVEGPEACALHAARWLSAFNWADFPAQRVLNLNYPKIPMAEVKGVRVGRMAMRPWSDGYEQREDPFGQPYLWLAGYMPPQVEDDTDIALIRAGWAAVTPLVFDRTDTATLAHLHSVLEP